jgi:hypothetical protein
LRPPPLELFREPLRAPPEDFRDRLEDFRDGTLAPFSRASLSPIAIACFRLLTLRPEPLFNVPFLRRRIADSTFFDADLPYLAMNNPPCTRIANDMHGPEPIERRRRRDGLSSRSVSRISTSS